jgi:hypothetical protein
MVKTGKAVIDFVAELRAAGVTEYCGPIDGTAMAVTLKLGPLPVSAPVITPEEQKKLDELARGAEPPKSLDEDPLLFASAN